MTVSALQQTVHGTQRIILQRNNPLSCVPTRKRLREFGDAGRDALVPLLSHARDDVRSAAASYLLRYRYEQARRVLEELARGKGRTAFEAGMLLKTWDEGTWELDPE